MRTVQQPEALTPVFLQMVSAAMTHLKRELQRDYEKAYPSLREIIHLILDEEEAKARDLSVFPHLFLPDLVEAHVTKLGLQPAEIRHDVIDPYHFLEMPAYQPALALCG
jgi:hypothetical protein